MSLTSTTDKAFLETLEGWLDSQSETMVLIRYSHAAGNKSFEFFTSFAALSERLHQLRPQTCITAFRRPQLPLRGVVDDAFIDVCLKNIPNGSEFVVVETVPRAAGQYSWFHDEAGETHKELLESLRGGHARHQLKAALQFPDSRRHTKNRAGRRHSRLQLQCAYQTCSQ